MNPFDRGLVAIYATVSALLAVIAAMVLAGWRLPYQIFSGWTAVTGFYETAYALIVLYLAASLRLIWSGAKSEKKHSVVQDGSLGKVSISFNAIESLVEKVVKDTRGVREAKAKVEPAGDGVRIRLVTAMAPDVSIPEVAASMQSQVGEKVMEATGIKVEDIRVEVNNVSTQRLRVE